MTDHLDHPPSTGGGADRRRPWVLAGAAAAAVVVLVIGVVGLNLLRDGSPDDPPAVAAPVATTTAAPTSPAPTTSGPASTVPASTAPAPSTTTAPPTTVPSTTASVPTTAPATTAAAPDYPPQLDFAEADGGGVPEVWGVYLAVDADPANPELTRAAAAAESVGYTPTDRAISCSSPGVEALGVPASYAFRVVYFSSARRAQQFVDAYPPGIVGTVHTVLACNDGAGPEDQPAG